MGKNLTRKILESHLAKPSAMNPGDEIYVKVDQTLTHDINAVMTYLAFEAIGLDRTQVETSVSYLDHNLLYLDNKTPDDHIYLQSVAKRYGVHVSRPGNGICHAVHVARFGVRFMHVMRCFSILRNMQKNCILTGIGLLWEDTVPVEI